jgi:predicted metal-dependent peptidase
MDHSRITQGKYGESMHLTPKGDEGYLYTTEEVYSMVFREKKNAKEEDGYGNKQCESTNQKNDVKDLSGGFDDHSFWKGDDEDQTQTNTWLNRMIDATEIIKRTGMDKCAGTVPAGVERLLSELTKAKTDWRTVLNDFIQEEINDYSFSPPDRRFSESDFFLPDYNEKEEKIHNILFMIDTSGSMSDEMITEAYSEIKGAIDQFGGKLQGWLGFFDAVVVEPKPFKSEEEFSIIRPIGGGGTSFEIIFDYVTEKMNDDLPVSIVILTDGYAPYPDEEKVMGIPVLWMINNEDVTPPWGRITRFND